MKIEEVRMSYRRRMICSSSLGLYSFVRTIRTRSRRSSGRPCGLMYFVPRTCDIPRFVAMITNGANSFSRARLRKEKHSMSSMCTSSMNNT